MHELTITQHILDIALEQLQAHGGGQLREIRLVTGPFSGIVPACVQMYFDLLSEGTPAAGAKIVVRQEPLRVRCRDCGTESELPRGQFSCPVCGSERLERLGGAGCMVESLEVD